MDVSSRGVRPAGQPTPQHTYWTLAMRQVIGEGLGSFPPGPPPARGRGPVGAHARFGSNTAGSVYHWMAALVGLCLMSCTALQHPPSSPSSFPLVGRLSATD